MGKIYNIWPYAFLVACGVIAFQWIWNSQHECPEVVREVTRLDTLYVRSSPVTIEGKPINTIIKKYDTIIEVVKGKEVVRVDTFYKHIDKQAIFTNVDTARNDSLGVALSQTGNCQGIIKSNFTFFGKQKVITNTTVRTISQPPAVFKLYAGAQISFKDTISDFSPGAMLIYKENTSFNYHYGIKTGQHTIGSHIKIFRK